MPSSHTSRSDVLLVPASVDELPDVAEVYLEARAAAEALGAFPPGVHSPHEVREWVRSWDLSTREVWIALLDDQLVGFVNLTTTWLDGLYVAPSAQGAGIGSALLDLVKGLRPGGFGLWVFECNTPAREFYARHGLVEVARTDGRDNEERSPDIHLAWPGS
ncbi:GNAT family N-acetyltransferase [Nocardioides gansuensis]|uniref:GNAT family N-acetyltransferase n=1 Tax=Nocardioides gansuensis TaxID=2138300 RepID=UPI0014020CFD|nr:GNAT family N-acetyltransferase [Nocardioides gansuensis]